MKIFILLSILSSFFISGNVNAEAREVTSITVEYREISKEGIIRVSDCMACKHKAYTFDSTLIVFKNRKKVSIETLAGEYWKAKLVTLFIKDNSNKLIKVYY